MFELTRTDPASNARLGRLSTARGIIETPVFATHNQWFWVRRRPVITAIVFLTLFYLILILGVTGGDQFIYFAF